MVRPGTFRREFSVPLSALQGELNRLLEHYWPAWVTAGGERPAIVWEPAVDLFETGDEVVVLADLPGVEPAAVDLTVDGRSLFLRGERIADYPDGARPSGSIRERPVGAFLRQVTLPSDVNVDAVHAEFKSGVLHVRLPKVEAAKVRSIPIQQV